MTAKTYVLTFTKESGEGVQRVSASKVEAVDGGLLFTTRKVWWTTSTATFSMMAVKTTKLRES